MNLKLHYHRILIDLDLADCPIGVAVETYQDGERTALVVLERPGPFDTVDETLQRARAFVSDRYGTQPQLPW